jgi:predicted RNA binding protein YcfA (HicA-like mRNA interferase family)
MIKAYSSREMIKLLEAHGWKLHTIRGDHHQFKHPVKKGKVSVPHPNKDLPIRVAKSILRQAGLE